MKSPGDCLRYHHQTFTESRNDKVGDDDDEYYTNDDRANLQLEFNFLLEAVCAWRDKGSLFRRYFFIEILRIIDSFFTDKRCNSIKSSFSN